MRAIIILLAAALCCAGVHAQVPHTVAYSGYLSNAGGTAVNASVQMEFKLYDVPTAGVALHTETQQVSVTSGVFNVMIGAQPASPLTLPFDKQYWLGVKVGADAEMTPRQRIAAAGYAIRAGAAEALAATATVQVAQLSGLVGTALLADGAVTAAKMATNGCSDGQILKLSGGVWVCVSDLSGGTVTSVATGAGLTGGPITGSGTISLADGGVTNAKLADGSVTQPKLAAGGGAAGQVLGTDGSSLQWLSVPAMPASPNALLGNINTMIDYHDFFGHVGQIALGADGLPVITAAAGDDKLLAIKCANAACTGESTITFIGSLSCIGAPCSSITVGADGLPVIAYSGILWNQIAKCANAACTGSVNANLGPSANTLVSIALGADGLPVTAFYDNALAVQKCDDANCSIVSPGSHFGTPGPVIVEGRGQHTPIVLGADGLPVAVWIDSVLNANGFGTLTFLKCGDAACSAAAATVSIVDSPPATKIGYYASMALGSDGLPVISYFDNTNGYLKVAKCADAACNPPSTITVVDNMGGPGSYSSITLGADGLPVIAYVDDNKHMLKMAKCSNAACAGTSSIANLVNVGGPGNGASITVGADGLPVIAYFKLTGSPPHGTLNVLKCSSSSCMPYVRRR